MRTSTWSPRGSSSATGVACWCTAHRLDAGTRIVGTCPAGTSRTERHPTNADPDEHDALAWLNDTEMAGLKLADSRLPALFEAALR